MQIDIKTTFKDGTDEFIEGDRRTVTATRAYGFIALGWAAAVGQKTTAPVAAGAVDLDIHNSAIGLGDSNG